MNTALESNHKTLILLIPGNPSVPGIYDPFLNQVVTDLELQGPVEKKVLPHLGQCNQRVSKIKNIRVQDVVHDHLTTIEKLIKEHKPHKTILIGHSLGSAVTISLYRDLSQSVDQFVVLCPFLGPSKNNERYLKLFRNKVTRMGMIGITHTGLAHPRVSRKIFKRWLGDNPFNDHIPREIKKPNYLHHFFTLVSNYFEDFSELDVKERVSEMDPQKSFFVFAPNDYWVPPESVKHLAKGAKHRTCEDISHDFCLKDYQYKVVSSVIKEHLQSIDLI